MTLCGKCGTDSAQTLTPRELSVAGLVAEGMSNRDLAAKLFLADKTVKNLVSGILMKLGVDNRTKIALWYLHDHVSPGDLQYNLADMRGAYTAGWRQGEGTAGGGQHSAPGGVREAASRHAGHRGGRAGRDCARH